MKKYIVECEGTICDSYTVEAENESDAESQARTLFFRDHPQVGDIYIEPWEDGEVELS